MSSLTEEQKKLAEFTIKLTSAIAEVIRNEESEFHISEQEIMQHTTLFVYAITATVPQAVANEVIGENKDLLEVNHLANRLILQHQELHKSKPQQS